MRSIFAIIPTALLLFAANDALAQHRPPPGGREPVHVDRGPVHVDRSPVHVDRYPVHVDRGPIHVVAPPVRWVAPVHTVVVDSWGRIDEAWAEIAWLRDEANDLERVARAADASYAERLIDDAENALDEAESVLAWRGSRSVYDAQVAQARASLAAAGFELDAMADEAADARARALYLIDEAEDAACDARYSRCTSIAEDAEELVLIGRSDESDGRYGEAIEHYDDAASLAAAILDRVSDRDHDDWDDRDDHGHHYGHDDDHDNNGNGDGWGHDRDDDDDDLWNGYYPDSPRHRDSSM
jgi:tetratricopeptide (TPR) repeat protein